MSNDAHALLCLIQDDSAIFEVTVREKEMVLDLQKLIWEERKNRVLQGIDPADLVLWKLKTPITASPSFTLPQRIRDLGDPSSFADKLEPLDHVLTHFPRPVEDRLHVLVIKPSDQHLSKRQRFSSPQVSEQHETFWKSLWVDQVNPIQEVDVRRDPDRVTDVDVPTTMKVLYGLPEIFSTFGVMIREGYDKAHSIIQEYRKTRRAVIIIGHPGIGKTMLLYYVLALRLLNRQPTIFQYRPDVLLLFDTNGVSLLSPHSDPMAASEDTWALVDCNESVSTPAPTLLRGSSPYFLIVSSSPRSSRWSAVQRFRAPSGFFFMEPFTLKELIQARQLQMFLRKESDIQNFFEKYGPSARDCFAFCSDIEHYHSLVCTKVAEMSWDKLITALTWGIETLNMDKVILIEPRPGDASKSRVRIITKAVNQLLWEQDSIERGQNHRQLLRTLRLKSDTKPFTGTLFEPPFHKLCVKGATFTLYPMTYRSDGKVSHIFVNDLRANPEDLVLLRQTHVVFCRTNPVTSLLAHHYYQPVAGSQPSYDSFVYDPTVRRITAFQVADANNHGIKPKGMYDLRDLAKKLQVKDLKLRFVIVVLEDFQVTCPVEKKMFEELGLEMYYLEMTESELYDD
ncbi:hypothetical protein D9615_003367 [Tricholomella constricta]|uniref:Crinkler effector protein N-terminal domain-containing protein n=1 Tax=Tricholomella constricta TaxID=117010 RepID=A0A8H5HIU7_9AGAR|nr:hypothetical protein D9615_003367 [Tricholomella constricta]